MILLCFTHDEIYFVFCRLNEGFTRFVESKIIGKLRGEKSRNLQAIGLYSLIFSQHHISTQPPLLSVHYYLLKCGSSTVAKMLT